MSRVNLDERVFGERRLHRLAVLMGWSTRETLGTLAYLWHESQSARRVSGTADEIKNWAWVDDQTIGNLFISSLETVGYIHCDGDEFIIHGNDAHIERLAHFAANASKGGKSKSKISSKRLASAKQPLSDGQASAKQPLSDGQASAKQPLSDGQALQYNAVQCSSVQCSSTQDKTSQLKTTQLKTTLSYSDADLMVGREWSEFAQKEMPWRKQNDQVAEKFAAAIAKVRSLTGINETGMLEVLNFVKADEFWRKNALSPVGLLKKSDRNGNRKIDNILVRMKASMTSPVARQAEAAMKWAEGK